MVFNTKRKTEPHLAVRYGTRDAKTLLRTHYVQAIVGVLHGIRTAPALRGKHLTEYKTRTPLVEQAPAVGTQEENGYPTSSIQKGFQ